MSRGPGRVRRDRQTGCVGNGGGRRLAPNKRLQLTMPADPLRRWVPLLMTLTLLLTTLTLLSSCNGWGWRWRLEFLWRPSPCDSAPYVLLPIRTQARRGIISRRQDATGGSLRAEPHSLEAGRVAVSSETRLGPCGSPAPVAVEASADLHHTDGIWWQSHERAIGPRSDDRQDPREDL